MGSALMLIILGLVTLQTDAKVSQPDWSEIASELHDATVCTEAMFCRDVLASDYSKGEEWNETAITGPYHSLSFSR